MENREAFQRAKKRLEAKRGFFIHLLVYIVVIIFLAIINFSTSTQTIWFIWPLIGWSIGVLFHALGVFVFPGRSSIKKEMVEEEMKKETQKKP